MTSQPRQRMTFNVPEPAPSPPLAKAAEPAPVEAKGGDNADRQQVGARVTKSVYRRLKAQAALSGVTVQTLVEQAISEFLAKIG